MELHLARLTQLRAFVAVGRRESFKRAAEDLHVTQSALSHQVRNLETELGVTLLLRSHRRIQLTDVGRMLLESCSKHLDGLALALERLKNANEAAVLTVSVAPYFSARWLTPRLARLWTRHPNLDLQLRHAYEPADFLHDSVDAGISWGHGRWPEAHATLLLPGHLTAVCSPGLRAQLPRKLKVADLLKHRLLYEFSADHWTAWLQKAGGTGKFNAIKIDDSHSLHRAILDGHGIGLFFSFLIREDVETGLLVQPLPVSIDPGSAYYLVRPKARPSKPNLAKFVGWVLDEARVSPHA